MGALLQPMALNHTHELLGFDCGNETLNEWLIKRALKNQAGGASRTFVICSEQRVVGYYALATGSVERALTNSNFARNMPEPIPVIVLGRLAIDTRWQGKRLGAALLKDALTRVLQVSDQVGIRGVLVQAISDAAKVFYQQYGFQPSPADDMSLLISVKTIREHIVS
ncbi:GNAT family N-acetyltransferase [Oceanobacter sp. 5_MG-2023]|uniref:GNAT family N-acetyltransferase n=1 Tax=Oceanobacter sp. 5_MG-2023 TaxID=3062645 RepID=UPI0026E2B203|nr:GNAT family N-acetyltransferase [Oceanobacter sp. 5_MG-2023]MDO6681055.1 GNAT family N-acetyltransferase [Oceanobacter sp. 5_MG-2023]